MIGLRGWSEFGTGMIRYEMLLKPFWTPKKALNKACETTKKNENS